jgi:hypothetical protein
MAGAGLLRSNSAHDFGAGLGADGDEAGVVSVLAGVSPSRASLAGLSAFSTATDFCVVEVALVATFGTTGLMGIRGTAGFVAVLVCEGAAVGRDAGAEGSIEDGVVGCVESASDGACEVGGVSKSDTGAAVEV